MASRVRGLRVLGVMTGTSCDGLDASCIEFSAKDWQPLWVATAEYPKALRKRVLESQKPGTRAPIQTWLELNRDLGEWFGSALGRIIEASSKKPDLIANHGQTVFHHPAANRMGTTLQLGDPARIAHLTGLTVVSQFRDGDMAAGGQGAPLVPMFHWVLADQLSGSKMGVAIHNIGGISNMTYIDPEQNIMAFDTGPGNIWIDAAVEKVTRGKQKFDKDGKMATQGKIDFKAVDAVLKHPYFRQAIPKSTGRDDFPFKLLLSKTRAKSTSLVATATAVTVESIAQSYERWVLGRKLPLYAIFLCGGGARNLSIRYALQGRLPGVAILSLDETGWNSQFVESQAFAFFGFLSLLGKTLGGSWTGVPGFAPPGHIIPGKNWGVVLGKLGL